MADRTTKVTLTAQVTNYLAGMKQAREATGKMSDEAKAKLEKQAQAMGMVGGAAMAMGAIAAAGATVAIAKFAEFDKAMSGVQAATHESSATMGLFRDAAINAGADTVFSATEAANAIEELSKAGVSASAILGGGLNGALSLASAGEIGVAEAAGIAATALTQFKLRGQDVPHVADLLAAGAGKAMGSVEDLSQALNQGGLVASQAGMSIEETTGTLAAFASAGLMGSDAGTSLKTMLLALEKPSTLAAKTMEQYGINVYDSSGNMMSMTGVAGQLQSKLGDLTAEQRNSALATIFGTDAVRSASVLYDQGAKGIQSWIDKTNDSGYAAETARLKLDNLSGDLEALGGSIDTNLIKAGSGANDVLRTLVQAATGLTNAVGDLPQPVLTGGLALGGLAASVLLTGGMALMAVPKIAQFKAGLSTLGISAGSAAKGIGLASGALAGAGVAFALYAANQARAAADTAEFKDSLDKVTGATTDYTRKLVAQKLAESTAFAGAKEAGVSQKELTDAVIEGGDALEAVQKKLTANNNFFTFFTGVGIRAGNAAQDITNVSGALKDSGEEFKDQAAAADKSSDSTATAATTYQDAADTAATLTSNLGKLIDTINKANGVGQDAVTANAAYQKSLDDVDAQIDKIRKGAEGYAKGLDISTESGRENMSMLVDLSKSSQDAAKAQFDLDGNTANYKATLEAGRKAVIDRAIALGDTAKQAHELADKIYAIPSEKEFKIIADTSAANHALDNYIKHITSLRPTLHIQGSVLRAGEIAISRATGGILPGAPSRQDNMVIAAASGEYITNALAASIPENRRALDFMNSGGTIPGYAGGGMVGFTPAPVYSPAPPRALNGASAAPIRVEINSQVVTPNGTLVGMIRGVAGEQIQLALADDYHIQERGYRG